MCIIGAGLAGLSAALCLAETGFRVEVFEAAEEPGGRARSWLDEATGDTVDIGPHLLLDAYANLLDLLERLGTRDRIVWEHDRFLTMVDGRREIPLRSRRLPAPLPFLPSMMAAPAAPILERFSAWRPVLRALRVTRAELAALDAENAHAYLRAAGVSERMIDWHFRSMVLYLLNVPLERCSAAAFMNVLAYLLSRNHTASGFATVGLSELYVPQALERIRRCGGAIHVGQAVREIRIDAGGVSALRLQNGQEHRASICVAAVPPDALSALLPRPAREGHFAGLTRFVPSPYISTYLWFERKLTSRRMWARPWTQGGLSGESYDLSNIRPGDRNGSLIATNIIYSEGANGLTDDEIVRRVQQEIAEYLPDAARGPRHARVHRIPMAVPCPDVGTEQLRPQARTSISGLVLAGDWTATGLPCSMESAARSGRLAAEAVCAQAGLHTRFALPPPGPQGLARLLDRRRTDLAGPRQPRSGM